MTGKEYLESIGMYSEAVYVQDTFKGSVKVFKIANLLESYKLKTINND